MREQIVNIEPIFKTNSFCIMSFILPIRTSEKEKIKKDYNSFFTTKCNKFHTLKDFLLPAPLVTLRVLNLTVLERGRHSPTVATSPTETSLKQGDM